MPGAGCCSWRRGPLPTARRQSHAGEAFSRWLGEAGLSKPLAGTAAAGAGGAADDLATGDELRAQGADLALAAMSVKGAAPARSLLRTAALILHPSSSHSEGER